MNKLLMALAIPLLLTGCATTSTSVAKTKVHKGSMVYASWYQCCKRTANGERFNPDGLTGAHRTLRFGTRVRVTHKGKSVVVRINDRGPFVRGRTLDLARGAARRIGCGGHCLVKMEILK